MPTTIIHIKNMVCDRCIRVVKQELENIGFRVLKIKLGQAELEHAETQLDQRVLERTLKDNGFELLTDHKAHVVEKIKTIIIEQVHRPQETPFQGSFSGVIQEKTGMDYHYLSLLFSSSEGITIEKFLILQRIERVKELLTYRELNLTQIADKVGYSSVAHLSAQFKRITGYTPTQYKNLREDDRRSLDKI